MKLVVCIVHSRDKAKVGEELVRAGFKFTTISSTGGFLPEGNSTLLIVAEDAEVNPILSLVGQNSKSREQVVNVAPFESAPQGGFLPNPVSVPVGGAIAFVLDVERFERF